MHHSLQVEISDAAQSVRIVQPECTVDGLAHKRKYSRDTQIIAEKHLDGIVAAGLNLNEIEYVVLCKEEHYSGCRGLLFQQLRARGVVYPQISRAPIKVPFDRHSAQWYTRGPIRVLLYKIYRGIELLWSGEIKPRQILKIVTGG
ncbi:MAG: hypothetical protein AAB351_03450 [Patescibacteria group bacterium]